MAMVTEPNLIMSDNNGWGGGGGGIWILLLAFLFMFRGGNWGGGYGDGREGRGCCDDHYKRHDAEFAALNRNEWDLQKEGIVGRYEARIADLECCCKTNGNIEKVSCAVVEQGEKTRALMVELEQRQTIAAMQAKIAELEAIKFSDRTAGIVLEKLGNWHCNPSHPPIPVPSYQVANPFCCGDDFRRGCPGDRA